MIAYNNGKDEIQVSYHGITASKEKHAETTYTLELPTIVCTDYKHAKVIERQVESLVSCTIRDLLDLE